MNKRPLTDDTAREAIRTHLDVTMMVEAAAGTGKTTSLVERMIALIRIGRCKVTTLAAITFTIKAASHLRERFHEQLQKTLLETTGEERERVSEALAHIERAFIGTTHAFCARLLRERPVEAAIDPEFKEADESEARLITDRFYHRYVERAIAAGSPLLAALREAGLPAPQLKDSFRKLTGFPDVRMHFERSERPDVDAAFQALNAFLDRVEPPLPNDSMRVNADAFEQLMRDLLQHRKSRDFDDAPEKVEMLEVANHKSRKPTQKNWSDTKEGKARAKQLGEEYAALVAGTLRPAIIAWREYLHGVVIAFLQPGIQELAMERRRNGTLTFEDLLLCARDLLRDHPAVRRYFRKRFTHLLVDEFQDTDPLQAEVMFYLTGEEVEERVWKKLRPRPGSLFVVGDPKQSIYRFRRADITTYLEVRERIVDSGGEVVQLSTNFRSFPSICTWVNTNFSQMFSEADVAEKRQAVHVDLAPHRTEAGLSGIFHLDTIADTVEELAESEAECLAGWIRQAVDGGTLIEDDGNVRPMEWRDVMLVSWGRKRLSVYARALETAAIPYEVTGGKAFAASDELRDLMPLLRCVVDPDDSVSLAACLRGPFCGVDDQALYEFARAGGAFKLFVPLPDSVDARIAAAITLLREVVSESQHLPPGATLARLFDRLGLFALASSRAQGGTRSGNLLLALSYARRISSRGASLAEVIAELEDLLDPESEIEEMDVDPARPDAVRLMNLHQVKGLEAPVVFLIEPSKPPKHPVESFIDRSGDESIGYFGLFRRVGWSKKAIALPKGWDALEGRERNYREAERKRALYVAATRAKNFLVVGRRRKPNELEGAWSEYVHQPAEALLRGAGASGPRVLTSRVASDFAPAREIIAASLEQARQTSYSVLPITKLVKGNHAELLKHEEGLGKGTSWGRVMHRLLEAMLRSPSLDVELYARNLLKDEERDAAELDDVLSVIKAVESSEIWARVLASPERYVEVPFAITVNAAEFALEGPATTLLHGQIDLVFREGDEWLVVDYKSDATRGRLPALVSYYKPQVEHYARFWSQLTGAPTRAGLFFVDSRDMVWV